MMRRADYWKAFFIDLLAGLVILITTAILLAILAAFAFAADRAPAPQPVGPVGFAEVITAALADAQSLPAGQSASVRYLDARHLPPAERRELYAVVSYHANGMSRESKCTPPRKVTEWLWAIDLGDYRWDPKVWEELRRANHYFSIKVQVVGGITPAVKTVTKTRPKQVGTYSGTGKPYFEGTEEYQETVAAPAGGKEDFIPAPWLPVNDMTALIALTGSVTPIVRADEFLFQTGAQADRKGHGYYDFLGFKSRKDAEQLAALDRKKAEELYRELAAIVPVSGVALNNRQVFRFATISGSWWESRDTINNVEKRNAVANLLEDFAHDAEEIVFTLPNSLPGYYLSDNKGAQIDSVPDTIAPDHRSTNNDRRIHAPMGCVTCHQDAGLKPVRDYARKLYSADTGVSLATIAADPAKARRLESAYLGPIAKAYTRDVADFGEAIEEVSGLKPAALAKAYERQWSRYIDDPVTLERAAAECGVTVEELRGKLRTYARRKGVIDPVIVGLLLDDPPPLRREYVEERFPVLMLILQGANP